MTAQDIIDLWCTNDFYSTIIVCAFLLLILAVTCYYLYQKFQDKKRYEKLYSVSALYNRKSIRKLYSQFLKRLGIIDDFRFSMPFWLNLDSYEEYLITFKGWTAQEVYQKIKEHLESILEEYKNTGAYCESDNHALSNFLAEIKFASNEVGRQKDKFERQKIDTKLSNFS